MKDLGGGKRKKGKGLAKANNQDMLLAKANNKDMLLTTTTETGMGPLRAVES